MSCAEPDTLDTAACARFMSLAKTMPVLVIGYAHSAVARKSTVKRSMPAGLIAGLTKPII